MKILHLLSQRPEATGSGIYIQAMIREAARRLGTAGGRPAGSGGTPGLLFLAPGLCPGGTGLPAGFGP